MAQKIGNLLDSFGSAKELLRREPEELGKVLLEYLLDNEDDSQRIDLERLIGHILFDRFEGGDIYTPDMVEEMRCRYPKGKEEDVLYVLMEGWQWLILEGFVAPAPKMRPTSDKQLYFVTRRGIKMKKNLADLQE